MNPKPALTPTLPKRSSLVAQTVQSLCEGIGSGHWRDRLPGERELSEQLQVGRRTIGAALAELQRKGWLEVAHRQRRRINPQRVAARHGALRRMVVVLSPSPLQTMSPQALLVMDVLRERLTEAGIAMELHVMPRCFTAHPARALQKFVPTKPAAVWVLTSAEEPTQRWFAAQRLPCLVVGSCRPGIDLPSVDADHRAACLHAAARLMRQRRQRIALVVPHSALGGDVASVEAMREAIETRPGAKLRVLRHGGTAAQICSMLDAILREPAPPTAYVVIRAPHVITVMMHLQRRGRRIPQDVAVIARDDDTSLRFTSPSVARYAVNAAQLARRISQAVRQLIESGTLPARTIRLLPVFVPGDSI